MKRKSAAFAAALVAVASANAQFATVSVADPFKSVSPGAQYVTFSGTINITGTVGSWTPFVEHAYLAGSFSTSDKIDHFNYTTNFYNWLAGDGTNLAGASYSGDIFIMEVEAGDEPGYYWHSAVGMTTPSRFWLQASDGSGQQSNMDPFSITIASVPEPASTATVGIALASLLARRRSKRA